MTGYQAVLVLGGLWLAACGGVSKEDFDGKLAEALCERYVRCGVYLDKGACEREVKQQVVPRYGLGQKYDAALADGWARYDAGAAGACLEKIRSGSCVKGPLTSQVTRLGFGVTDDCRFLTGVVDDGKSCVSMADCGPQSYCTSVDNDIDCHGVCRPRLEKGESFEFETSRWCAPGLIAGRSVCEEPRFMGEGQTCGNWAALCEPGLYCTPMESTCRRFAAEGEACALEDPPGRLCAWNLVCSEGICRKRVGEGAECMGVSARNFSFAQVCGRDFFCDAARDERGTCRALLPEGAACRGSQECAGDLYCAGVDPRTSTRGTCQRRYAQVGERCDDARECAAPAACFFGTCRDYAVCGPFKL
jgi:hypothetical protein